MIRSRVSKPHLFLTHTHFMCINILDISLCAQLCSFLRIHISNDIQIISGSKKALLRYPATKLVDSEELVIIFKQELQKKGTTHILCD